MTSMGIRESPEDFEARMADLDRRRTLRKAAVSFSIFAVFGVSVFLGALYRGTVSLPDILSLVAALMAAAAAITFWRDSSQSGPDVELKPTATPSSLVE